MTPEDVCHYFFDAEAEKFLSKKGKKYLLVLFEQWDLKNLQLDEDFDDYPYNEGLEAIMGDRGMQNVNNDD